MENIVFEDNVDNDKWVEISEEDDVIYVNPVALNDSLVPDLKGMNITDAVHVLETMGWNTSFDGMGKVKSQSVKPGTALKKGSVIKLVLSDK